jgi:hypothetical protein
MDAQPYNECGLNFEKVGVYKCLGENNAMTVNVPLRAVAGKALICEGVIISIPQGTINEIF